MAENKTPRFPKTLKPVREDEWFITENVVEKVVEISFKAIKIGNAYLLGYLRDGEEKHYIIATPSATIYSYENEWEALEALVNAIRSGERIEHVDVNAAMYVVKRIRRNKHTGHVREDVFKIIEWEDGGNMYSVDLEEFEEIIPEGP